MISDKSTDHHQNLQDQSFPHVETLPQNKSPWVALEPESTHLSNGQRTLSGQEKPLRTVTDRQATSPSQSVNGELESLKDKVRQILRGEVAGEIPLEGVQEPLNHYYQEKKKQAFEQCNIPPELVQQWQTEGPHGLTGDPVIESLSRPGPDDQLRQLELQFRAEGINNFACKELHPMLNNIKACLQWYGKSMPPRVNKALKTLEQDICELQNNERIPYRNFLALTIRFICIQYAMGVYQYREYRKAAFTEDELVSIIEAMNDLTFEKLSVEDEPIYSRLRSATQTTRNIHSDIYFVTAIKGYCREDRGYLMWFCFDPLNYKYFPISARYLIYPAGIQIAPLSYQNHGIMNSVRFSFHDFDHGCFSHCQVKDEPQHFERTQRVLEHIVALIQKLELSPSTTEALWFNVFYAYWEKFTPLYRFGTKILVNDRIATHWVTSGEHKFDEGMTKSDLSAGCEVFNYIVHTTMEASELEDSLLSRISS